ncbi:hypothetical protein [Pseudomonas mandelii]|uniref:hypothetical protein n=1 Tax=Pseudomonas mandelii TaxID=75612 RepID=UPI00224B643B|nr:hypothetical protein [Pseudomonas mandelii]MCX2900551.1 hypothetical protein [Pseudomonas mandelii]
MDGKIWPCTAANPRGLRRQPGLLGTGTLPFPSEIASRSFPIMENFAGYYATSDYNAAMFLAYELSAPDAEMTSVEAQESVHLLCTLLKRLRAAPNIPVEAFKKLQQMAEAIPQIGPLLFSPTSLPGTLLAIGTIIAAAAQSKALVDLLDLSAADKKKLVQWANSRGSASSQSAKKAFRGRVKLIRVAGQLHFEVPVTAQAQSYRVLGQVGQQFAHIPAFGTKGVLDSRAMLHANGASRGLKLMTGGTVGSVLAVGPQAYFDYSSSSTMGEFFKKSAYSQPTNVAALVGGALASASFTFVCVVAGFGTAPLVLVLGVGLIAGAGLQYLIQHKGADRAVGNHIVKEFGL